MLSERMSGSTAAKSLTRLSTALGFLIASHYSCFGQTLAQTAAYILNGGFVDLGDMKQIDENTVHVPSFPMTIMFYMRPMQIKVLNKQDCIVSFTPLDPNWMNTPAAFKSITLYFNKVIAEETTDEAPQPAPKGIGKFNLFGEEPVACVTPLNGTTDNCLRKYDTTAKLESLPRIYAALKYLYSTYCKSARRRNAF